jgi:hypothetical protein
MRAKPAERVAADFPLKNLMMQQASDSADEKDKLSHFLSLASAK